MSLTWSEAVAQILALVESRTGWDFPPARSLYAEVSLRQQMSRFGLRQLDAFVERLRSDDAALDTLIEQLLIYESYFFRDKSHFRIIRERWVEELQALRPPMHKLRIWSAGCASGEEPYSLAIVLFELFLAERSSILATDISRLALAQARQGLYASWSLRDSDEQFIASYFSRRPDGRYLLHEHIRKLVRFEHLNLNGGLYPSAENGTAGLDLIMCRNVGIYLARPALAEMAQRLYDALSDGGWLLLGPSDPLLDHYAPFEIVEENGILVHKRLSAPSMKVSYSGVSLPSSAESLPPIADFPSLFAAPVAAAPASSQSEPNPDSSAGAAALPASEADFKKLMLEVRALADANQLPEAERAVLAVRQRFPVATEFIFLHMVILLGLHRYAEAAKLASQLIFLDSKLAIAHFLQGTTLRELGDENGARRAFENVLRICAERLPREPVTFSEGESHGRLGQAAAAQLAMLAPRSRDP